MQIVAVVVFVVAMVAIMSEKVHRALVAIVGAMILLVVHVVTFDQAMSHVDFNTLGVLLGMMLFVAVVKLSGIFEYLAIKCARLAKGNPWHVMVLFVCLTALLSALLDNVTTVLLIGPMTITVCRLLDIDAVPFFLAEIMASNIGGTATLIGDPPNIMIGSAAGYSFVDFVLYDTRRRCSRSPRCSRYSTCCSAESSTSKTRTKTRSRASTSASRSRTPSFCARASS